MPTLIPVSDAGNREIVVDTRGGGVHRFRTYFSQGSHDGWFLDIADYAEKPLLRGIRIVPGCPNLLKGQGDRFHGLQLACAVLSGKETAPDALGNGACLVWFNAGEENPFALGDPLLDIPYDQWAFHHGSTNRFFDSDGAGRIFLEAEILAGTTDPLATVAAAGDVRINGSGPVGAQNEYFAIDAGGDMRMKV